MGCTCSSKKDQSPQKTTKSTQSTSNQLFLLVETKMYKIYRPNQKLQNISNSTILKRRRIKMEIKDLEYSETK
ncbi:unnamed protein product [Paramecium pentaurelia]|uniref:Uncharacterized protein n=1 Tax=Paramecium pentaurelia TaxID=43138 RepID=A0A8S1SVF6_9CILI|nr:unnamed protein product [Paramecium pentaurelia]